MTDSEPTYRSLRSAGIRALHAGAAEQARIALEQACELAAGPAEHTAVLAPLAQAHAMMGQYAEAERLLAEADACAAGSPGAVARVRMHRGAVCWQHGDIGSARNLLEQAQVEFKRLGMVHARATALGYLATVLLWMGEYQPAIDHIQEALALQESLDDPVRMVVDQGNLADCLCDLGAYEQAEVLLERALAASEHLGLPALSIDLLRLLGCVRASRGCYPESIAFIRRALCIAEQSKEKDLHAQALASLADTQLASGDVTAAITSAGAMMALAGDVPYHRANALLILGRCHLVRGEGEAAVNDLQAGLLAAYEGSNKLFILRFHAALSQVVSQPAVAQVHRRMARELTDQIADTLQDKALRATFLHSPLVRSLA